MKINLRKSLDFALKIEEFSIKINLILAQHLIEQKDLDDNLVVTVAEICNSLRKVSDYFHDSVIPNLQNDMLIMGDISEEDRVLTIEEKDLPPDDDDDWTSEEVEDYTPDN